MTSEIKEELMMKCGHSANSYMLKGDKKIPGCVICNCFEVAESKPSLEGRKARCSVCGKLADSNWDLAFFKCRPDCEYDEFYDGCNGWD